MNKQTSKLVETAKSLVGKPYKYGAKADETPDFFDCSLFTQYLFKQIGIEIPRSTIEQAEFTGTKVNDITQTEPGDIIFFRGERGHYNPAFPKGIGHCVLYIGDNKVIHAASKRIQHNPIIVEKGEVRINSLKSVIERSGPVVIIKRVENDT